MSWWANKLGTPQSPQTAPPPQYYPAQPYQQPQYSPQQTAPQPQQIRQPQTFSEALAMGDSLVSAGLTRGNQRGAATHETYNCPECGSGNYFDRSKVPGAQRMTDHGMVTAAPLCMDCGYRGMYIPQQYGELNDAVLVDDPVLAG